jgi:hypothetical protein
MSISKNDVILIFLSFNTEGILVDCIILELYVIFLNSRLLFSAILSVTLE